MGLKRDPKILISNNTSYSTVTDLAKFLGLSIS